VQPYGGGLWTTWFDRDLTIAGRVIVGTGSNYEAKLLKIDRPILRIPTLAIHLDRDSGSHLEFNKQTQMLPILATSIKGQLDKEVEAKNSHHSVLLKLLAEELKCKVEDIRDFELSVVDTQKSVIGGICKEFIFSPRLDNLMMSFCALTALSEYADDAKSLANEKNIQMIVLFDHEEVGSQSSHGAGSPIVNEVVRRITASAEKFEVAIRKSFLISADMAHSVHPNYSDKHEPQHKPAMHKGTVIKWNVNQRYASTAATGFYLHELAKTNNIPVQDFVVRNDALCGSTIGPIVSGNTGIRTVDIGNPQLSMHSIREMCATSDLTYAVNLLKVFFLQFTELDEKLTVD